VEEDVEGKGREEKEGKAGGEGVGRGTRRRTAAEEEKVSKGRLWRYLQHSISMPSFQGRRNQP